MKGSVVALIIVGTVALTIGGICFGVGLHNKAANDKVIENRYDITDAFENIDIDLETADLYIKKSNDTSVKVECNEREKLYQDVKVESGSLKIKTIDQRRWYEKYIFAFNFRRFDVTVYLPTATYNNLKAKTATGDVNFEEGFTFSSAYVKTSTGNINYQSPVSESLELRSDTGNIKAENFTAKNASIKTSTGNITVEDVTVTETLTTNSSTGNHKLTRTTAAKIDIHASTGNVNFNSCDASESIKVKTSTGDIKGTLLTGKTFSAHSGTGSVHVPDPTIGAPLCQLESSTGRIDISIA